ncbi:MAG: type II toxin-antitoxin system PrlF family antitoxin [Cellvibrionales bacterium]|nr:type II toxin-antitoxin system PrlF family antitoxin [Cellvibrionales bacterium]
MHNVQTTHFKATLTDKHINPTEKAFLRLLEQEITTNPQRLKPYGGQTTHRAAELVAGMDVDLNAPLTGE